MFIDIAKILIKSGNGGDGAISFHTEKYIASGGPDGGNGGKGGDIVFQVDDNLSTLGDFRYKKKYIAKNGENGKPSRCTGKNADDLIIRVPRGTLIKDIKTGKLIADISTNQAQIIAKGGKGGSGNKNFANSTRQTPRFAKSGNLGIEIEVQLELKLLADVGLIGYPNVGKSTLLSVVSEAKPKIAEYPFTTITPVLGVVNINEYESFVMADIPGLIDGAFEGIGLGHQFLRHIERCRLLVHIVDISGSEGRNPIDDFKAINEEIRKFNTNLSKTLMIVVGNKCDLATENQINEFKNYIKNEGYEFFPIMAAINHNVKPLLNKILEMLKKLPPIVQYESEICLQSQQNISYENDIKIIIQNGTYCIESEWLLKKLKNINFDDNESFQYFQKLLIKSGIIDKLKKSGMQNGDNVKIYDMEFEYLD